MARKRGRQGKDRKKTGPPCGAPARRVSASSAGRTQITVVPPREKAGKVHPKTESSAYPPSAVLKVQGDREYEIARLVARGGMGVVYEARERNCERFVAVKLINGQAMGRREDVSRFIQEAKITSQLEHPNIVPVHDLGNDVGRMAYYTMKYVQGVTLTDALHGIREGKLDMIERFPLERLLTVFQKVCDAVAFAHSRGIVHCDLKPGNVMIGS